MNRDSFVFYRSFYEALETLDDADRLKSYDAIIKYALDGFTDASGVAATVLTLAKPVIDSNNKRYLNGCAGGRPKKSDAELNEKKIEHNKRIRNTTEYKKWRDAVMKRDGGKCAKCGETGGRINAHHIKNIYEYPELAYDVENGIALCSKCHAEMHADGNQCVTTVKPKLTGGEPYVYVNEYVNVNEDITRTRARAKKTKPPDKWQPKNQRVYDYDELENKIRGAYG